jgi:hypothetical protein
MKKQFVFSSTRKALIRLSVAAVLFFNAATAFAGGDKNDEPVVNITYVGVVEDRAQFQFDLVTEGDDTYLLAIRDENGNYLYKEKIGAKTFTKKFQWLNGDPAASKLVITVTGLKSKKTQSFEINTEVRTVRDVVISKM